MKVLIINGSPRENGNTTIAVNEMVKIFEAENVETDVVRVGNKDIRGCIACGSCSENGKCVFDDPVNELAVKFKEADGLVIATHKTEFHTNIQHKIIHNTCEPRHIDFPFMEFQQFVLFLVGGVGVVFI